MNKIINIFAFLMAAFFVLSCEPSRAENGDYLFGVDNPGETGGTTNSRLLKKMVSHLKDDETGEWEDGTSVFNYTNSKLVSIDDDLTGGRINLEYNSANKISKLFLVGALTANFEYSGTTLSKITTEITGISKSVTNYTFVAGKVVKSVTITDFTFLPIPVKTYTEDTYEYQNNNVTKNITKIGAYDPITGELVMDPSSVTSIYEYDTKKNPFTLLPKEYLLFYASITPQTGFFNSVNNPLKSTITEQDGTVVTATTTHLYDDKDYVTKSSSGEEYYLFEYQN